MNNVEQLYTANNNNVYFHTRTIESPKYHIIQNIPSTRVLFCYEINIILIVCGNYSYANVLKVTFKISIESKQKLTISFSLKYRIFQPKNRLTMTSI